LILRNGVTIKATELQVFPSATERSTDNTERGWID